MPKSLQIADMYSMRYVQYEYRDLILIYGLQYVMWSALKQ